MKYLIFSVLLAFHFNAYAQDQDESDGPEALRSELQELVVASKEVNVTNLAPAEVAKVEESVSTQEAAPVRATEFSDGDLPVDVPKSPEVTESVPTETPEKEIPPTASDATTPPLPRNRLRANNEETTEMVSPSPVQKPAPRLLRQRAR